MRQPQTAAVVVEIWNENVLFFFFRTIDDWCCCFEVHVRDEYDLVDGTHLEKSRHVVGGRRRVKSRHVVGGRSLSAILLPVVVARTDRWHGTMHLLSSCLNFVVVVVVIDGVRRGGNRCCHVGSQCVDGLVDDDLDDRNLCCQNYSLFGVVWVFREHTLSLRLEFFQ